MGEKIHGEAGVDVKRYLLCTEHMLPARVSWAVVRPASVLVLAPGPGEVRFRDGVTPSFTQLGNAELPRGLQTLFVQIPVLP